MNEKNVQALKTRLVTLGFEPSVETMLRCNICFAPVVFELVHRRVVRGDVFHFTVSIQRDGNGLYELWNYTATLCKEVEIPQELASLENSMKTVDWNILFEGRSSVVSLDANTVLTAYEILRSLDGVGGGPVLLKYKYWAGTKLEPLILDLPTLRSHHEISDRFHFYDESALITFDDAIRFLSSRWMEKQMALKKKLLVKKDASGKSGSAVSAGKLLTKNPRKAQRRSSER